GAQAALARAQGFVRDPKKAEFILSRIAGLVVQPNKEWQEIKAEETTIPSIIFGFVAPLAGIPPLCDLIGSALFARPLSGNFFGALLRAIVTFGVSLALVYLLGLLINMLAEAFEGERNGLQAQKVAAYSMAPAFLSGFFSLWPPIWWVSILPVGYAVYL